VKHRLVTGLLALGLLAMAAGIAACGHEEELDVKEGEPVELGELLYSVQITRFLNPDTTEDATYLEGLEAPPRGSQYLGVFMRVENEGSEPETIADHLTVTDIRGNEFEVIETESPFALELGATIEGEGELPEPGSPAASGPIKGGMVLFLIPDSSAEDRPLELEIPGDGESGRVELDL
jgi:hypothetical protein